MKMRKFFSNRTKKKKSSTSLDSKVQEIPEPLPDQCPEVRKKGQQKKRGKKNKYNPSAEEKHSNGSESLTAVNNSRNAVVASNGVVLRRPSRSVNSDENSHLRSPNKTANATSADDPRLPGSESSSRTASSASSSSYSRWSARRPWSLVDSFGGQALEEFAESHDVLLPRNDDHHNVTAPPAMCTLPRGTDPALLQANGNRRPKTLAMDFSIFRFFRRSNSSRSPDGDAESESSVSSSTRGSFRLKDLKGKKNKKRRSEGEKSSVRSNRSSTSTSSEQDKKEKKRNRSNSSIVEDEASASTLRAYEVCDRIEEEELTPRHQPVHRINSSSVSIQDSVSLRSSTLSECSQCHKMRKSVSEDSRRSSDVQISIVDTDPPLPPITTIIRTRAASSRDRPYSSPCSVVSSSYTSASTYSRANSREIYDDSTNSTSDASTIGASAIFGGSLCAIDQRAMRSSVSAQTLPRRLDHHHNQKDHQGLRTSALSKAVYSSLPQLFAPAGIVGQYEESSVSSNSTKSSVRFSDPDQTQADNSRLRSSVLGDHKSDPSLVDSPIKRAIGYPGVVLRRHHNRRTGKKFNTKSASADLLTSDRRKQVMSLNMEDLPTYGEMRGDELRWRSTSLFTKPGSKNSYIPGGELDGRARFREALLYQRYSSHCTSVDDVRGAHFGARQTFKDIYNLDDDEFLDMYLASSDSVPSSGEANKINHNQVLSV